MKNAKIFLLYFVGIGFVCFCITFGGSLLFNVIANTNKVEAAETSETVTKSEEVEVEIEYEPVEEHVEEILPEGLYLYCVNGAYLTIGVENIGNVSGTGQRAVSLTFYGTSEQGDVVSTYEDIAIQSASDDHLFEGIDGKYNLIYQDNGKITIDCLVDYDDLDVTLRFENEYIYLYSFEESTVEEGDMDYE